MPDPGDVVIADFPGAIGIKRRPAVVVSTPLYHTHRPDVILGLRTTQIRGATAPTDYILLDWAAAGLRKPTVFRSYLATLDSLGAAHVGRLSDRDWQSIQTRLGLALAISPSPSP